MIMLERARQTLWALDHLDDLESDFSAFHRVDDISAMDAPRFFRLAPRLTAYQGVMAARLMAEQQEGRGAVPARSDTREVPATRTAFQADPNLVGLVSWGAA